MHTLAGGPATAAIRRRCRDLRATLMACAVLRNQRPKEATVRQRQLFKLCVCVRAAVPALIATAGYMARAQSKTETYTADASVTGASGKSVSAQMTAVVQTFATDAERDALVAAVGKGGTAARDLLRTKPDAGSVQIGAKKTPVKYAYARTTGTGKLITLVTAEPIGFIGGNRFDAKPKEGYDLGLVLLDVDPSKPGARRGCARREGCQGRRPEGDRHRRLRRRSDAPHQHRPQIAPAV